MNRKEKHMGLIDEMAEDSCGVPEESEVSDLASLIQKQVNLENLIAELEMKLDDAKAKLFNVSERDIPEKFNELRISSFTMEDGSKVEVKPYYAANINEQNHNQVFEWLRKNDMDDIIKHEVKVAFGKGEDSECNRLRDALNVLNVNYTDKEYVHPQTLKAFVKEQIEKMSERLGEGEKFPMDLFSVHIGNKTKITKKRK
jgi:hypothetical protein